MKPNRPERLKLSGTEKITKGIYDDYGCNFCGANYITIYE